MHQVYINIKLKKNFIFIYLYLLYKPDESFFIISFIFSNAFTASLLVISGNRDVSFFLKEYINS